MHRPRPPGCAALCSSAPALGAPEASPLAPSPDQALWPWLLGHPRTGGAEGVGLGAGRFWTDPLRWL